MHRAHHDEPAPPIVKPPAATLGALFAGLAVSAVILGPARVAALWAGVFTGYLVYEISHLAAHLLDEAHHPWPAQRARHLLHHRSPGTCFGITSHIWDAVFGTLSGERR
jgi:sterol desaturase/sphingolipid hydroxylase (fatty acid hydroxylase superfamily)